MQSFCIFRFYNEGVPKVFCKIFQIATFSCYLTANMVSDKEVTAVCGTTEQQLARGKIQRGHITNCLAQRINRQWLQSDGISRTSFEPVGSRASPGTPEAVR